MPDTPGQPPERYAWLADALGGNGIILTASRRLARELGAAFNEWQIGRGVDVWVTPRIRYWHDWARDLLLDAAPSDGGRILNPSASLVLWERCLRRQVEGQVAGFGALARQAAAAWQRLAEWRVPIDDVARAAASDDQRAFARAARQFHRLLTDNGWFDASEVAAAAIARLESGADVPDRVRFEGFDRWSPLVGALMDALERRGAAVLAPQERAASSMVSVRSFADVEAELRGAGDWARHVLEQSPRAKVGIVCPDLDTHADRFARLIREGLVPGWQTGGREYEIAVDVSFGRRFASYPAIAAALLLLRWAGRGLPSRDVSLLLRSRFVGGADPGSGADLELRLRQLPDRDWTATSFADAVERLNGGHGWARNARRVASLRPAGDDRRPPSAWAERFDALLASLGWPGDGVLDSDEFQLMNRWRELLNEFASLDLVLPEASLGEAVARLSGQARDTVYQPESPGGLVDLLGPLEAAGMEFDHLCVTGMDAAHWPAPGNPLALVSRRLQRDYRMPDATPAESVDYARRVIGRLAASAAQVRFSWSRIHDDSVQLRSPLLDAYDTTDDRAGVDPGWHARTIVGDAGLRATADPVPAVDGRERVAGGAGTVELQRREPFLAFVRGRLGVNPYARFQAGLSARIRGVLLHSALCELYRDTPRRDDIRGWRGAAGSGCIDRSLDRAFAPAERQADAVLRRLLALERARLRVILDAFVEAEAGRRPFEVRRVEEQIGFSHDGVELDLRIDRADRLQDGSLLIIDYKTGAPRNLLDKDGDLAEIQLVVYSMALEAATDYVTGGVALVNLNRRSVDYRGVGAGVEWGSLDETAWERALSRWQADVREALEEMARGDARVTLIPGGGSHGQLDVLSRYEELRRGG